MLFDGLVSFDLPARPGSAVRERGARSLESLVFDGSARVQHAECTLSAAVVLSRCFDALRGIGARRFAVGGDVDELFELTVTSDEEPPPRWPDLLPPRWTDLPAAFWLRGQLRGEGVVGVVRLRYSPRHRLREGALNGSLRLLRDVAPRAGCEARFGRDLRASLEGERALRLLHARLENRGVALGEALLGQLRAGFGGLSGAAWGRAVVLHPYARRPGRFAGVLDGFEPTHLTQFALLDDRLRDARRAGRAPGRASAVAARAGGGLVAIGAPEARPGAGSEGGHLHEAAAPGRGRVTPGGAGPRGGGLRPRRTWPDRGGRRVLPTLRAPQSLG